MSEPVLFEVTLNSNPPMPGKWLRVVLVLLGAVSLAFGLGFVLEGAWMVTPFMGLDIALLAWAFHASTRAARRHEKLVLTPSQLLVERVPPDGPPTQVAFNPYWVRVDMQDPPEHWSQLTLWSHGRGVRVGTFLPPEERLELAHQLKAALRKARESFG